MRLDRLLFFLRFARTRAAAQGMIAQGHLRLNGARVTQRDRAVGAGDVLTLPVGKNILVAEILALPDRRGPAPEAQSCYRVLDAGQTIAIAEAAAREDDGTRVTERYSQQ